MSIWLILAIVYGLIVAGFLVAMYGEAPKHASRVELAHWIVALAWPFWAIWYLWVIVSDWFEKRRKRNVT